MIAPEWRAPQPEVVVGDVVVEVVVPEFATLRHAATAEAIFACDTPAAPGV